MQFQVELVSFDHFRLDELKGETAVLSVDVVVPMEGRRERDQAHWLLIVDPV